MLHLVVCVKQVPMVSELPWDPRTGTLRREMADGMMDPACKHALEAALQLRHRYGASVTAVTMGPPMAREILHEAVALGADRGVLLTDPRMAGADTMITARTLAAAIHTAVPEADLVLCGNRTSDSETGQVGPQLAGALNFPSVAGVESLELSGRTLTVTRRADGFRETLEMALPALITVDPRAFAPRYPALDGVCDAFGEVDIRTLTVEDIGLEPSAVGLKASPTAILDVTSAAASKENVVLSGPTRKLVNALFETFGDRIGGAMGKDLKTHCHTGEEEEA
jgi:electron transfer flavoprotein beta subunit